MSRKRTLLLVVPFAVAIACGSTPSQNSPPDSGGDANTTPDSGGDADAGGGGCCPIDPQPGCCMRYGGWSSEGADSGLCGLVCDGMPVPSDPSWKKVIDSHGCEVWTSALGGTLCGSPLMDASGDVTGE